RTRLCNPYTTAHWAAAPEIMPCLARDDARDRVAPPVRGDRAPHGWCFWRGREYQRTCASGARGFCERPNWSAHASHSKCSSPPETEVGWRNDRDVGFGP